jgi:hypothetical protein
MNAEIEPRDGLNDEAPDSDGKLGVAKTARFLQPFTTELGTCTEDRRELLTDRSLADVLDEARRRRTNRNASPSARGAGGFLLPSTGACREVSALPTEALPAEASPTEDDRASERKRRPMM